MPDEKTLPTAAPTADPYAAMMGQALAAGPEGVAALKELIELRDRERADQRRLEYLDAKAGFLGSCPTIKRKNEIKVFVLKLTARAER